MGDGPRAFETWQSGPVTGDVDDNVWKPWKPALWENQAYETRISFKMPYMDLVEDIYVHSDEQNGLMRLSYYSGANVFLINTTGDCYELLPVINELSCLQPYGVHRLETIMPDLSLFLSKGTW